MKRIVAALCSLTMIFWLVACSGKSESPGGQPDYSNETLTGQVISMKGAEVILQLGELGDADMSGEVHEPDESAGVQEAENMRTLPEEPEGGEQDNMQALPEKPEGEEQSNMQAPPEKPEGEEQNDNQEQTQMPSGEAGMPPGVSAGRFVAGEESVTLDLKEALIQVEDGMNTSEGGLEDITIETILVVEMGDNNSIKEVTVKSGYNGGMSGGSGEVAQGSSANTLDSDGEYSDINYCSAGDDENALRIDGASVVLTNIAVEKTDGLTSSTEDGDFYGMNAALLATDGANVEIYDARIISSAQNGNGVFSYGEGTAVTISDSNITTTADNSGGIQTTGGGTTNASNLTVETSGNSSAAIRSDRGGGTVHVDGGSYISNGYNSPAVYSTAEITVKDAELVANNSEALVIEGKNSITLENCDVNGNMSDTQGASSDENVHNVMIYQSMSGDADVGTSSFSMTGGTLDSANGDMFYVTNTHCTLLLSDVTLVNKDREGYLLRVSGNSAGHGWGTAGANGGQAEFTADHQMLEGEVIVDTISTLRMTLTGNSNFTGTVNIIDNVQGGTAVSDNAAVIIDSGSTWTLTGDCTLTSLENSGTINFNGHTITLADGTVLK